MKKISDSIIYFIHSFKFYIKTLSSIQEKGGGESFDNKKSLIQLENQISRISLEISRRLKKEVI